MTIPLAVALAIGVVTAAAYLDVRYRRIPNWLTAGGLSMGLVFNLWQTGASGAAVALIGGLAGLALLLPFYVYILTIILVLVIYWILI